MPAPNLKNPKNPILNFRRTHKKSRFRGFFIFLQFRKKNNMIDNEKPLVNEHFLCYNIKKEPGKDVNS